jgi:hypothetical protein
MASGSRPSGSSRSRTTELTSLGACLYIQNEGKKDEATLASLFARLMDKGFKWSNFDREAKISIARYASETFGIAVACESHALGMVNVFEKYCDHLSTGASCDPYVVAIMATRSSN